MVVVIIVVVVVVVVVAAAAVVEVTKLVQERHPQTLIAPSPWENKH
jgi:hypothetical protein